MFSVSSHPVLVSNDIHEGIHLLHCCCCRLRLHFPDVVGSEEELPVEIGQRDGVHVCNGDAPLWSRSQANHGEIPQQLAADGPDTHQEIFLCLQLLLKVRSKDRNLPIISTTFGLEVLFVDIALHFTFFWQTLESIKIHPLIERQELPRAGLEQQGREV